jgi:hypothetical protein
MRTFQAALIALFVVAAGAVGAEPPPAAAEHPCHKVEAACKAAGFAKGGGKIGKGLFKDCVEPVLRGQAVAGVTVDPTEAQACAAVRAKHGHQPPKPATTP